MSARIPGGFFERDLARAIARAIATPARFTPGSGARCPLCGEWNGTRTGEKGGRRYHSCAACGLPYTSVPPGAGEEESSSQFEATG